MKIYVNLYISIHILLECKIHTIKKSISIKTESSLNECLQYSPDAHWLQWKLIGQNKVIQLKIQPSSSTTSEWSKVSQKDLFLTRLHEASSGFFRKGQKMARRDYTDQKLTALLLNDLKHAIFTSFTTIFLISTFFQRIQFLIPTTARIKTHLVKRRY